MDSRGQDRFSRRIRPTAKKPRVYQEPIYGSLKRRRFLLVRAAINVRQNVFQDLLRDASDPVNPSLNCWQRVPVICLCLFFCGQFIGKYFCFISRQCMWCCMHRWSYIFFLNPESGLLMVKASPKFNITGSFRTGPVIEARN